MHPSPAAGVLYLKLRPWNLPPLLKTLPKTPLSGTGLQNSFRSGLQLSLQDFSLPVPLGPPGHPAQLLDPGPLGSVPHMALDLLLFLSHQLQHLFLLALLRGCLMARGLVTHTPPHRCPLDCRSTRRLVSPSHTLLLFPEGIGGNLRAVGTSADDPHCPNPLCAGKGQGR